MAITAATLTSGFSGFLTPAQSAPIFDLARQQSVVQRLARQIPLGATGVTVPVTTGKLTAGWVSEGATKPASSGTMTLKTMTPKKIGVIAVVSAEVVRADPGNYMENIRGDVAEAFATAFDAAALHGTSTPFTTYVDQTANSVEFTGTTPAFTAVWTDLNSALNVLLTQSSPRYPTGWALDARFEPVLNGSMDTTNRPLFIESPLTETAGPIRAGRLMGRDAFVGPGVYAATGKIYGYLGDWSQAAWGTVGGINYSLSTEATVTINGALTSLWENNLVAVLAEAEYGWLVNDLTSFCKLANNA
jgi:HK97 family phage major capsid protein